MASDAASCGGVGSERPLDLKHDLCGDGYDIDVDRNVGEPLARRHRHRAGRGRMARAHHCGPAASGASEISTQAPTTGRSMGMEESVMTAWPQTQVAGQWSCSGGRR